MALLIDEDGKETTGGIAAVRDAFQDAGEKKLTCLNATMGYDHSSGPDHQVLTFSGRWADDGTPFAVTSDPIAPGGALAPVARALARKLLEERAGPQG